MSPVSRGIDRVAVTLDEPNLVANAGLLLAATLVSRLGLEGLINDTVRLCRRVGGASPGHKVLTLVHALVAAVSHVDHADTLCSGATSSALSHQGGFGQRPRAGLDFGIDQLGHVLMAPRGHAAKLALDDEGVEQVGHQRDRLARQGSWRFHLCEQDRRRRNANWTLRY